MQEIWKDIEGYEGLYRVSNLGRVKSILKNKIISTKQNNRGYMQIHLYKNAKCKMYLLHRLVAQAFIPNINNYPQVNHKDENKQNNNADNLEWCSNRYNAFYGTRIKRAGEKHRKKVNKYDENMNFICTYNSLKEASKSVGLVPTTISDCCNGRCKTAGGYVWRFKELN